MSLPNDVTYICPAADLPFMHLVRSLAAGLAIVLVLLCGCLVPDASLTAAVPATPTPAAGASSPATSPPGTGIFALTVDNIPAGSVLPKEYTCTGSSETPGISWTSVPSGTKSLVFILDDPDAPSGTFTHWLLYNIPTETSEIGPDQQNAKTFSDGTQVGMNSAGSRGYYPPCPPVGTTHRYFFRLYAVDVVISQPAADRAAIDRALDGHILGETQATAMFAR